MTKRTRRYLRSAQRKSPDLLADEQLHAELDLDAELDMPKKEYKIMTGMRGKVYYGKAGYAKMIADEMIMARSRASVISGIEAELKRIRALPLTAAERRERKPDLDAWLSCLVDLTDKRQIRDYRGARVVQQEVV